MKVIKDQMATLKRGRRVTVELAPGEKLVSFHENEHYRTGYPCEDIVSGRIILESHHVQWCSFSQEWVS